MPARAQRVQYVIRRGVDDNVDYNMDGKIDENDDIVIKYVNGKEVSRRPLNARTERKIGQALMRTPAPPGEPQQRIVYQRVPRTAGPVVVKDDSSFGHFIKAGAGLTVGNMAVEGLVGALGSLFSSSD